MHQLAGKAGQGRAGQGRAGQGRAGQGRAGHGRAGQGTAGQAIMQAHIHMQGKQYNKRLKAANMTGETGKHTCIDLQDAHASASCRAGG